jgi:hypothetical protein
MDGGYSKVYNNCIKMLLKTPKIQIQIVREKHNLPIVFDSYVSPKAKKLLASTMRSGLCHTHLNALDFFQENTLQDLQICAPLGFTGPNTTRISAIRVSAQLRMKTSLLLRKNFSSGIEIGH